MPSEYQARAKRIPEFHSGSINDSLRLQADSSFPDTAD
jgi:hypothetical protein